jgi:hypothetical protein
VAPISSTGIATASTGSEKALAAAGCTAEGGAVNTEVVQLLRLQAGVVARRQVLAAGLAPHDIRRLLRRHHWAAVHSGVYVEHTGPLGWQQRAWAAVLYSWPSALYGESAMRAARGPGRRDDNAGGLVHVAVDRARGRLTEPGGVRIHYLARLAPRVQWNLGPPRLRLEEAALELAASAATDFRAIALLADVCQSGRTTPARIRETLRARQRSPRRKLLDATLEDVAAGTCSVLEHGYLHLLERAHGLPTGARQVRATASTGVVYRDVDYEPLVVELDGRLFHDTAAHRDRDFERDLDAATDGRSTIRLSYGQVFDRPCSTAGKLARVMAAHGIAVHLVPCGPSCSVRSNRAA